MALTLFSSPHPHGFIMTQRGNLLEHNDPVNLSYTLVHPRLSCTLTKVKLRDILQNMAVCFQDIEGQEKDGGAIPS